MLALPPSTRIFVCARPVNMCQSFDGLAAQAREVIGRDPLSGHLFVFRNRKGHLLKALFWDGNGFAVYYKRLERGTFRLPAIRAGSLELSPRELASLLAGLRVGHRGATA
jgi:transposase